ncbi:GNAT family N-acetyltransferase [Streptomyces sp. GC420]|uniref:GNAT family N-acetyltransferase n=1 Tax=Streptomyces sp. GC420 TaxID=2697568 RepID=UPI001414DAC5|nr:GNAT family N-acetyltransferase [Streptomyces sp. GC420]NBM20753.1 GNAT family N-acetyltransferase [Streptomyces sp. GC420]
MTEPRTTRTTTLRTAHTAELSDAERGEIRSLMDEAFDGDFGDEDWDHCLGGVHALVRDSRTGLVVGHGSVVQRRVLHRGRSLRVGYVEAVAVREGYRCRGAGGQVMAALERIVDGAYVLGALSATDEGASLYARRGWRLWAGPLAALGPSGQVPLPDEEDSTYVRPAAGRALPDPSAPLVFDWRDGDVL